MNIAIIGHVDHGKSTLIGRLLYDSDAIPESRISEMQALADQYRRRFEFGYFMDAFAEEIRDERTVDTTETVFKAEKLHTIIDVPGHKEFTTAMLTGTCHADAAVLVVDATKGLEEQSRRHFYIASMLGITRYLIAINKMDLLDYDEAKFKEVADDVYDYVKWKNATIIPISAFKGENVYKPSDKMAWADKPLARYIDELDKGENETDNPLRFIVQDNYDGLVVGRVESGVLKKNDMVRIAPAGVVDKVEAIETYKGEWQEAYAGDCVGIRLIRHKAERGDVASIYFDELNACEKLTARVIILKKRLNKGDRLTLRCGTASVTAVIADIKKRMSSETGETIKTNAKNTNEHEVAVMNLQIDKAIVAEPFKNMPCLGRITLADNGRVVGAGTVDSVG